MLFPYTSRFQSVVLLTLLSLGLGFSTLTPAVASSVSSADLPASHYQHWLAQITPISTQEERDTFLALASNAQREAFMEAFWRSRDDDPETPFHSGRERYERQFVDAANRFGNLMDGRAQMAILHGAPRYIHQVRCDLLRPLFLFYFPRSSFREEPFTALFVGMPKGSHYFLWSADKDHRFLVRDFHASGLPLEEMLTAAQEAQCFEGQEQVEGFLKGALEDPMTWQRAWESSPFQPVDSGWLESFQAELRPDGKDLRGELPAPAGLDVAFPTRQGPRTVLQGHMRVREEVLQNWISAEPSAGSLDETFLLTGLLEWLDPPKDIEHLVPRQFFRQRFHLGADGLQRLAEDGDDAKLRSLFFYRDAFPGHYALTVRLQAPDGTTLLRDHRELNVPVEPDAVATALPAGAIDIAPENLAILANRPSLQIVPMPALQTGTRSVQVMTSGSGIVRLRFALDGEDVGQDDAAPWGLDIDFGVEPRPHFLQVEGLDSSGEVLAADSLHVNAGAHRFGVRLTEPRLGEQYKDLMRIRAAVELPTGGDLDRLEIYLEETPVATLYHPPFVHMVALDPFQAATYVKAVAHLTDGTTASDLVVVNVPGEVDELDVRQVELFASVLDRRQRPVRDLAIDNFRLEEDGVKQELQKVKRVEDLPVHLALLIDNSSSMVDELPLAVKSTLRFFDTVLTPEDQAAVVTFNHGTRLAVPFTRDLDWLAQGVSTLSASGGTTLWDSTISTLHYFGGLQGKRAIVLMSDGDDQHSHFKYEAALAYSQRAGVSIYALSLDVILEEPDKDMPRLNGFDPTLAPSASPSFRKRAQHLTRLEKLAKETGGLFFKISKIEDLDEALEEIGEDVRSQYLLTYQSSQQGSSFRQVKVQTSPRKFKVRSVGGYYP